MAVPLKRTILVVMSDSHGGFKLGLMQPETMLYSRTPTGENEMYRPAMNEWQTYIANHYRDGIEMVAELADGDPVIVVHNGDPTHGDKHKEQLVSTRNADQIIIARDNLEPWMDFTNLLAFRLTASTNSHVFGESTADLLIAELLRSRYKHHDIEVIDHGLLTIDGAPVDVAHHGPGPGSRFWLKGNIARYYLRSLMMSEAMAGRPVPALVVRSHFHEPIVETVNMRIGGERHTSTIVITPALCGLSGYGQQATKSVHAITTGFMAVEFVNGKILEIHEWTQTADIRTKQAF